MGLSPEAAARLGATAETAESDDDDAIEVLAENEDAVRLFLAAGTQWRVAVLPHPKGAILMRTALDYAVLPVVAGALGLTLDADLLDQLQTIEAEAAHAMAQAVRL
ncbi:hypothetical protein sos41_31260 [Alphaproteobacteria bacterium SO-S41]|nr:hypothetical protein sos41_31260 [Alphaproteobacteria bacterium SO-S41]